MVARIIEQKTAVNAVLSGGRKSEGELVLSPDELTNLEHLQAVLAPLAQGTTVLCVEVVSGISLVCPIRSMV